ncbi:FixH family protein [Nocardia sp. NPDC058058]|uniref:FixH family protein n=1 Tax=Nocardia sp. NPDC058058 TaxID=3346317 RepID=UPI0036D7B576
MTARRWILAVAALLVAALAVWWLWPDSGGASPSRMTAGPYRVALQVAGDGARVGDNTVDLEIDTAQGDPAVPERVIVAPAMPQMGHALPTVTATATTPGHYRAGVNLPMPGQWEITVQLSGPQGPGSATFSLRAN